MWQWGMMRVGEGADVGAACAAGIDEGGDSGVDAADVGVHAGGVDALEHVDVDVDDAGGDDPALDVDDVGGVVGDIGGDAGELTVLDGDVHDAVALGGGVDDGAAFEYEVVHGWCSFAERN